MVTAHNPVMRGMNPDPSIVRVGEEYFAATSTFEWFPGVRLHRSRNLAHWETVGHALDSRQCMTLEGVPDSGGVWAPSLSYADGRFWLVYSVVHTMDGDDLDAKNYLTTAEGIEGPWDEPVFLGSRGFDFSLAHLDGRHWAVGVQWDQRPDHPSFAGIVLEEYLPAERRMAGRPLLIASSSELVEGPNLYHHDGWYYLLLAEGGTGWNHGITVARARDIRGPYEFDPAEALLTTRDAPGHPLQKAGHGELVQTPSGDWMLVHLASRPILAHGERYSPLGRETCIQAVEFTDDSWLRLVGGGWHPALTLDLDLPESHPPLPAERDDFDDPALDYLWWSTLRRPLSADEADLMSRPGWLRLRGGSSPGSVFGQSMIARPPTEHHSMITALIDAEPSTTRQSAGVVAWYNRDSHCALLVCWDAENGRHARVVDRDRRTRFSEPIPLPTGPVRLRLALDDQRITFAVAARTGPWHDTGIERDAWRLSDDHGGGLRFTGIHLGVRAEDLDGTGWSADIDYVDIVSEAGPWARS